MKKFLTLIFTLASALSIYGQGSMRTVQTLDQLLAINPAAVGVGSSITNTVYSVLARNSSLPYNAARTFRNWRGTPYTTNIANVYPAVDGSQWVAEDRTAPIQDSTWWTYFNNSADSTAALQAAINSQPKVLALMTDATITQLLVTNAITFQGYGITFYQFTNGVATNFIQVASNTVNVRFQGITFDGRNQAARCIRVDQNTDGELLDCTFQNFQEFNVPGKITTVAFYVNGGGTAWTVDSCIFKDLTGLPDGGIATGTGFTCGIYINREFGSGSGASSVKPKRIDIVRSKFLRILPGEDSDAIRWTDSGWVFDDINVSVDHCYFEDIGKRAFKASGSGGQFVNNIITNSFDGSFQATGWVDVGNLKEQYAVVSLYGRNLLVANNRYNGGRIRHFFESTINEDTPLPARNEIYGNIFVLSTNWGLNGLSVTNIGQGTMFGGIYRSSDINVHDNYGEVVQFGVQVFSGSTNISIRDNHFVGLANTNNLVEAASTNGWGRGVRLGRYSTNGYVGGAVQNAVISGNFFDNFGAAIDLSETTNTFIGMNYTNRLNRAIVINETAPDGSFWPADIQISGGNYGAITLLRQLELAYEDTDSYSSHTNRRGGLLWDRIDQAPAFWDGAKWSSLQGYTRKNQTGGATDTTHWYRVATMWDKGYTTRGSTKITIGSGGGPATSSAAFQVINNYSDAQILMEHNFAVAGIGGGSPISAVRVVRDTPNEKLHFDFQPASALNSLLGVEVQPDWTTQAGMEPTNSWQAVQFTDMGTSLSGTEVQIGYISNITSKVFAFNGDQWNWWFGPDKFGIGEGPLSRFYISNSVPTTAHAPIFTYIDGAMNQFMRDPTSGVFYASTYKQPHQVIGWGMGLTNSGTNVSVSLAAGTNITITSLGNTYVINSSAASSVTYTNGVTNSAGVVSGTYLPGANVTFTTNGSSITIASTGGGSGPTNGSAVYVKGTGVTTINLIASGELDPTYSGTNLTYAIVGNSIATNKIDSTFYAWINDKQSALSFSTGVTNSGGTVTAALAPGSNVTFTTNANTITIASAGTSYSFTNGVTNSAGIVQSALVAGANITLSTNAGAITITAASGGGTTNGTPVYVNGVQPSSANFTNSAEITSALSGTNVTHSIVANSIATNKIDSTFYNFINNKQSALTFSTGTTNSGGTVTAALAAGTNVVFTTNANTITINAVSTNTGGSGTTYAFLTGLTNYAATNVSLNVAAGTNVVFTTNGTQVTINASVPSSAGSATTVHKVIGTATFNWSNTGPHTGVMNSYTNTGVITNYTANSGGSSDPLAISFDLSGVTTTNYVVSLDSDATVAVWGNVYWVEDGYRKTNQVKLVIGSAAGSLYFAGNGFTQRVTIYELATVGGSGGSSPTTTRGDVIVRGATNDGRLAIGKLASFLASDGIDPAWMTPARLSQFFDDMVYVSVPSVGGGTVAGTTANGSGAGATLLASEAGETGIIQLNTGSTSTGNNRYQIGGNSANTVLFGSATHFAAARVKIPTASSATDRFSFRFGYYDTTSGNAVDGAYFDVTDNINSGNWVLKNYSNSTATTNATAVASVAGSWATLLVLVDSAASAAQYYVDGTLAGTVTGGLPTGAGRETRVTAIIEKTGGTAGTNSASVQLGFVWTGTLYPAER